jgi:hypothetical protein
MGDHDGNTTHPPFSSLPLPVPRALQGCVHTSLHQLNSWVCRLMYGVTVACPGPISAQGPALIVCDHTSMGDPLVLLGVLNDNNFQGHIDPQARCISEASGRFKKVRPARPQSFLRAERTSST